MPCICLRSKKWKENPSEWKSIYNGWRPCYALMWNDSIRRTKKQLLLTSIGTEIQPFILRNSAQKDRLQQSWLWLRLPEGVGINNLMLLCFNFLPIKRHNNVSLTHSLSYLFILQGFWGRKKGPDKTKMNACQMEPRQNFNSYVQSRFRNAWQQPIL